MGWVDRVNRYFLDALTRRQASATIPATASSPALQRMSPGCIGQLARLDLASHDQFVGESWMLWGTLVDGTPVAIGENDPGWADVQAALDHSGRSPQALHLAQLKLLADPERRPLRLIGDV